MTPSLETTPIPYVTTLEQVYEEFNDSLSLFITFLVINNNEVVRQTCIPWVRFRQDETRQDVIIARNCDCDGEICGQAT